MSTYEFNSIYAQYKVNVIGVLHKMHFKDPHVIKDIVQTVFIKFWTRDSHDDIESIPDYLAIMAKNTALKFIRDQRKRLELQFDWFRMNMKDRIFELEIKEPPSLSKIMDAMSERQKECWVLSRLDGLTHEEIADRLQMSKWTVSNHLKIAKRKLKPFLPDDKVFNVKDKEEQILRLLHTQGLTRKQIARNLGLSEWRVIEYLRGRTEGRTVKKQLS